MLLTRCWTINCSPCRCPFKGWNLLQLRTVLTKWWYNECTCRCLFDDSLRFLIVVTTNIVGNYLHIRGGWHSTVLAFRSATRSTGLSRGIVTLRHVCAISLAHSDAPLWKCLHLQVWETPRSLCGVCCWRQCDGNRSWLCRICSYSTMLAAPTFTVQRRQNYYYYYYYVYKIGLYKTRNFEKKANSKFCFSCVPPPTALSPHRNLLVLKTFALWKFNFHSNCINIRWLAERKYQHKEVCYMLNALLRVQTHGSLWLKRSGGQEIETGYEKGIKMEGRQDGC